MGLSIIASGGIIFIVLLSLLFTMPSIVDSLVSVSDTSSQVSALDTEISQTDTKIQKLWAFSGSNVVNFDLLNEGNEKLWAFENFNILITYDADTGGATSSTITEEFTYNATAAFDSTVLQGTADFKFQSGVAFMLPADDTVTITEGQDFDKCTGDCFIELLSNRHSGNGRTEDGASQNPDEFTAYISDITGLTTDAGTITFTRTDGPGGNEDNRIHWIIWEYIGEEDGPNEMKVLDSDECNFGNSGELFCNGTALAGNSFDVDDIVVFLTGQANDDNSNGDIQNCLVTSGWDGTLNRPVFQREDETDFCDVSYAVVEWSGSNWSVQNLTHAFTGAATQTSNLGAPVRDIGSAFIHTQQRTEDGGSSDNIENTGTEVELINTNTIEYRLPEGTGGYDGNSYAVTWVIANSETDVGERMIVNRYNPAVIDPVPTPNDEYQWDEPITPLTYYVNGSAITGFTAQGDGTGTSWPRSFAVAILNETDSVRFWQSDAANDYSGTFEVSEFPRVIGVLNCVSDSLGNNIEANAWTINYIQDDNQDPQILNTGECAAITSKLSYPIATNGVLIVTISTDNGIVSSLSKTVS